MVITLDAPADDLFVAEHMVRMLEERIAAIETRRMQRLLDVVDIFSKDHAFLYVSDTNGHITIDRDAPYVMHGLVVVGDDMASTETAGWGTSAVSWGMSIERMGARVMSRSDIPEVLGVDARLVPEKQVVPKEMFIPALRRGDSNDLVPSNVDYWCRFTSQQLIPPGDTLRCSFVGTNTTTDPVVVLVGAKVLG